MADASISRISRPMYCSCRRSAPNLLMRLASSTASSKLLRQLELGELGLGEGHQLLAEILQRVHLALAPGLADRFRPVLRLPALSLIVKLVS